ACFCCETPLLPLPPARRPRESGSALSEPVHGTRRRGRVASAVPRGGASDGDGSKTADQAEPRRAPAEHAAMVPQGAPPRAIRKGEGSCTMRGCRDQHARGASSIADELWQTKRAAAHAAPRPGPG
ncbi:unnamed protein product, partial [Prorocentrum cordatum]